jgi:hypothetical protein
MMSTEQSEVLKEIPAPVEAAEAPEALEADAAEKPDESGDREAEASAPEVAQDVDPNAYDSEARQRIPVSLWQDEGRCDVTLICEPVGDETLANYARMVAQADASEAAEEDEGENVARQLGGLNAATAWLFKVLMTDIEGYGLEGEEKPGDWRERLFGPAEMAGILNRAIFAFEPVPPPAAKQKARPSWASQQSRAVVSRFRAPFNARTVDVAHTLRRPDAARLGEYVVLQSQMRNTGSPGVNLEKFAAGYDSLHVSHEGYRGRVPPHHKALAYVYHLNRVTAGVRKN